MWTDSCNRSGGIIVAIIVERLCMRHESINERIKNYACLVKIFTHGIDKHSDCFRAAAVITQISLNGGDEFMDMHEYDDRVTGAEVEYLSGV